MGEGIVDTNKGLIVADIKKEIDSINEQVDATIRDAATKSFKYLAVVKSFSIEDNKGVHKVKYLPFNFKKEAEEILKGQNYEIYELNKVREYIDKESKSL